MKWLQDNLPVILIAAGMIVGYIELRAPQMLSKAMDERGLVEAGDFNAVKEDVAEQKATHNQDTEEWKRRLEKIVDILLEE